MAQQNFRVKRGLEVGLGATILSATHDGKIGINQATPIATLDVNGNTELDNLNVSGVSTFVGNLKATHINISGVGTFPTLVSTNGTINYLETINTDVTGIGSISKLEATNASIGVATITTIDVTGGDIEALTGTNASISGIVTASEFKGDLTGNVTGALTGNADTATTLATARDFSVNGDVATASAVSFDGSSNVNLSVSLSNNFSASTSGTITASGFFTGAEGSAIRVTSNTISGPATLNIDPSGVGDNTGTVVIKGDLQVDGTQTIVNSTAVSIDDKNLLLGDGTANDAAADGGGITLESADGDKTFNWIDSTDSWTSSENLDLVTGKTYKIAGTDVLSATTLGSGVVNSSLTSVGTLTNLNVAGIVTATLFDGNLSGNVTGIADEAVTLQSTRNFSATGDVTAPAVGFDGSANVNLVLSLSNTFSANTTGTITALEHRSTGLSVTGLATISQLHLGGLSPDGTTFGISNYVPVANGSGGWSWQPIAAAGGGSLDGISILEEGSSVGAAGSIISVNFTGDNVTATATGTSATVDFNDSPTYQNIVSIQSNDGTSGRLDLYCEVSNAHYTRLQAAPHSTYSGNNTLILPVIDGTLIAGGSSQNTVDIITTGDVTANSIIKSGGTSSQFLKADGSVDGSAYLTSYTETDPVVAAINGIVKSNGTTISAAVAGTDYLAPTGDGSSLTNIVTGITAGTGVTISGSTGNVTINATATGSALTLKEVASRTGATNTTVSNVEEIRFNNGAGFSVLDEGSGVAFVDLGSTFNPWYIDGQDTLKATGEEPIEFVAGPGIAITTKAVASVGIGTTFSKAITINAKGYVNVGTDFPSVGVSTTGDTFYHTDYGKIFVFYDGFWVDTSPASGGGGSSSGGGGGGATVTTSDTAPLTPSDGDLWWDSAYGQLKMYYDDGQDTPSAQWVDASPPLAQPNVPVAAGFITLNGTSPTWTGTTGYTVSGAQPGGAGTDYVITLTFPTAYSARTDYIVQATYDSTNYVAGNGASIGVVRGTSSIVFTPRRWDENPLSLGDIMVTITNL